MFACIWVVIGACAWPSAAFAHGPVSPVASSFLARPTVVPPGLQAKVIDGDQRLWLTVSDGQTVVVLDSRGAPYLRFTRAGVEVNRNSAMYYLNQTPAELPPSGLGRTTPPRWARVGSAHDYSWHDGRLHALAGVSRLPGTELVGRWSIPVVIGGRLRSINGGLWHAPNPSIVWFWPILVLIACVLAAWRVRSESLDRSVARALAAVALVAIAVAAIGQQLHGRPSISAWQLIVLVALTAFVGWGVARLIRRRHGYFFFFAVAIVALWEGIELIPTLLHGYVLMAVPAFPARSAAVLCLGAGIGLLVLAFRLGGRPDPRISARRATAPR